MTVVGISFNQSSYYVNEKSNRIQIEVYLSSPLPFDVNATINEVEKTATSGLIMLHEYMHMCPLVYLCMYVCMTTQLHNYP